MRKSMYGTRACCKHCGQDVEFMGRDFGWQDHGGNRSCGPYTDPVTKNVTKPKTKHAVKRLSQIK